MSVFNGGRYLTPAVESVLGQTYRNFEFIIVDDGSTDATATILDRYATVDKRVRVVHQANTGIAGALNRGCQAARTDYIVRMDADDIAFADRVERQVDLLERQPQVALLGGAVVRIDSDGAILDLLSLPTDDDEIQARLVADNAFDCYVLCHAAVAMRKKALETVGGYRPALVPAEDFDLYQRLAERYHLANLEDPVLYYRVHPGQASVGNVEAQVAAVLAGRAAARIRRAGGADPLAGREKVDADLLRRLCVDRETLAWYVAQTTLFWQTLLESDRVGSAGVIAPRASDRSR